MNNMRYLLIVFVFFACENISEKKESVRPKISTVPLDTIKSFPSKVDAHPVLFENAFIQGSKGKLRDSTVTFYGVTIGKLKVPSGRIVACDPYLIEEYGNPFTQVFPTGEFPIQLSIARMGVEEAIAFVRIHFCDEPVARWEFALLKDQTPIPLDGEKSYGYVVDAGMGSFMDEEAKKALEKKDTPFVAELYKELQKNDRGYWKYAIYNFDNHNMVSIPTFMGDGLYSTYIGFDAGGKPCRLLTDFGLFQWWKR